MLRLRVLAAAAALVTTAGAVAAVSYGDDGDTAITATGIPPSAERASTSSTTSILSSTSQVPGAAAPSSSTAAPAPADSSSASPPETTGRIGSAGMWMIDADGGADRVGDQLSPHWRVSDLGIVFKDSSTFRVVGPDGSVTEIVVPPCPPGEKACDPSAGRRGVGGWDVSGSWLAFSWSLPYGGGFGTSRTPLGRWDEQVIDAAENHPLVAVDSKGNVAAGNFMSLFMPDSSGRPTVPASMSGFVDPASGLHWTLDEKAVIWRGQEELSMAERDGSVRTYPLPPGPSSDVAARSTSDVFVARWPGQAPTEGRRGDAAVANLTDGRAVQGLPGGHITQLAMSPDGSAIAMARALDGWSQELLVVGLDGRHRGRVTVADGLLVADLQWLPDGSAVMVDAVRAQNSSCRGEGCVQATG